jgi:Cu(I)/Ag(I) efflux system membrane fusion protein
MHEPLPEGDEEAPRGVRGMAVIRWLMVIFMALVATAAWMYSYGPAGDLSSSKTTATYICPMHPGIIQDQPGSCPICGMTLVPMESTKTESPKAQQEARPASSGSHDNAAQAPPKTHGDQFAPAQDGSTQLYQCPMHPDEQSGNSNAQCPKCGMRFVPINPKTEAEAAKGHETAPGPSAEGVPGLVPLEMASERIQLMGMRTAKAVRAPLTAELRTVGVVTTNEEAFSRITTRFSGWVEKLHVSKTGQHVRRGQVVAEIYSPELISAQQEFLSARHWAASNADGGARDLGGNLGDAARRRLELLGISEEEIHTIAESGQPIRALKIRSPVTGNVIEKRVVDGAFVQPGTDLMEVADLSRVWVLADVYENQIRRVAVQQEARLQLDAYPGETFRGKVQFIYPSLDPATRTLRLRIELSNTVQLLKPGMYGNVMLDLAPAEGVTIPSEALVDTGEHQYVFIASGEGRFAPRRVVVGARSGDKVQILTGVADGETVVTTGNFLIDSESRLRAAIEAADTTPRAPETLGDPGCRALFDIERFAQKYEQCRACEIQHRGMGTMAEDCRNAIPKPWR